MRIASDVFQDRRVLTHGGTGNLAGGDGLHFGRVCCGIGKRRIGVKVGKMCESPQIKASRWTSLVRQEPLVSMPSPGQSSLSRSLMHLQRQRLPLITGIKPILRAMNPMIPMLLQHQLMIHMLPTTTANTQVRMSPCKPAFASSTCPGLAAANAAMLTMRCLADLVNCCMLAF